MSSQPLPLAELIEDIPQNEACVEALKHAHANLPLAIFNHSFRVYKYGIWLKSNDPTAILPETSNWGLKYPTDDLIFLSAICHDWGASGKCCSMGSLRFEVEGANAAVAIMRKHSYSEADCREVWIAIAIHTTAHISDYIGNLPRLIRFAVASDFSKTFTGTAHEMAESTETTLPRLEIEKVLGNAVMNAALEDERKAPENTWARALVRAYKENPDYEGVNPAF